MSGAPEVAPGEKQRPQFNRMLDFLMGNKNGMPPPPWQNPESRYSTEALMAVSHTSYCDLVMLKVRKGEGLVCLCEGSIGKPIGGWLLILLLQQAGGGPTLKGGLACLG